jgi:cholestenol Delta-isomerase
MAKPYSPKGIRLLAYQENSDTAVELVMKFGGACTLVLVATWLAISKWRPDLKTLDKTIVLWFVLAGSLHIIFEGYFVYNHSCLGSRMDALGQLWKEYALSDSRYLTADTFVLSIETITTFVWGPLSFCTAYLVATSDSLRYPFQAILSLAHIYGCMLYYATATVDMIRKGTSHSRPEFLYFWVYYIGMNAVFILVPGCEYSRFAEDKALTPGQYCYIKACRLRVKRLRRMRGCAS